jgi:hypothetical protein
MTVMKVTSGFISLYSNDILKKEGRIEANRIYYN